MDKKIFNAVFQEKKNIKFHMPGHKGRNFSGAGWENFDTTELQGTDNLREPKGVIHEVLHDIAQIYHADRSLISVNGATAGIMAGIMGTISPGEKLIVPRNSHTSVHNALYYGRISPVFIEPVYDKLGYPVSIDPLDIEKAFRENENVKGIMITNPTYYGTCCDIHHIKELCRRYRAALIIDEAHGAHLEFNSSYPVSGLEAGGDVVIQSTHKILSSLNQGALVHIKNDLTHGSRITAHLNRLQTSSPSYPIMISVESSVKWMYEHGKMLLDDLSRYYDRVEEELKFTGINMMADRLKDMDTVQDFDKSKLWLDVGCLQKAGIDAGRELLETYHIQVEIYDGRTVLAMMGAGTKSEDVEALITALKALDLKAKRQGNMPMSKNKTTVKFPGIPGKIMEPWEADSLAKSKCKLEASLGKVSGGYIIPYPPGVPVLIPGELICRDVIEHIKSLAPGSVIGLDEMDRIEIIGGEAI
ncbi:MAG: aminotransferase class I/II-fold pyridoxal phosphate-dependent enzyme [Eubacteriaceae bacterium]|nr:aminotransferase class I/II-fold pyridoxal phosphate-dependent enzyme [Eubacteriaceae bacterium]